MNDKSTMLSSSYLPEIIKSLDGFGLTGTWSWNFDTREQTWSPGLYRILGLHPDVSADYKLFYRLIHPEDKIKIKEPAEVTQTGFMSDDNFRILRADGSIRRIISRSETHFSPSGRPSRSSGIIADISDQEILRKVKVDEQRKNRAVFDAVGAFTSVTSVYPFQDFSEEFVELVGLPKDELLVEPTRPVVKTERRHWRDYGRHLYLTGKVVHVQPNLVLANRDIVKYRMIMVPIIDENGNIESWCNYIAPLYIPVELPRFIIDALDNRIESDHIRAARGLLDWSMGDLAAASGLSLSSVRRIEKRGEKMSVKSVRAVTDALRQNGIHFTLTDDASIMLRKI